MAPEDTGASDALVSGAELSARYKLPGERPHGRPRVLSDGPTSRVLRGMEIASGRPVAIKVVHGKECGEDIGDYRRALQEMKVHREIARHPNILRLLEAEVTPEAVVMVTPLMPGGDLWPLMRVGQQYCEREVQHCASQLLVGLRHLHVVCNLVHGDIKPHNLLLAERHGRLLLQISDFGLAQHPRRDGPSLANGGTMEFVDLQGTSGWLAPEQVDCRDYGAAVDMFAAGLILFRMIGGYAPFDPPTNFEDGVEFDATCWGHVSPACVELVDQLLAVQPADRCTAPSAVKHSWIAGGPPPEPSAALLEGLRKCGVRLIEDVKFWHAWELAAGGAARGGEGGDKCEGGSDGFPGDAFSGVQLCKPSVAESEPIILPVLALAASAHFAHFSQKEESIVPPTYAAAADPTPLLAKGLVAA